MIQRRYEISDEQWEQIKDMFPSYKTGRPSKLSDRTMFNAILWIARSGAAWRDLPEERYGSWKTVYSRFCKWRDAELLVSIFRALHVEPDFENLSIDSTSVKAQTGVSPHAHQAKENTTSPKRNNAILSLD
ncbi:IS5 family transposase [Paenibacillus alvei]|uniref:IS5 family transposase n=1 Tax=Paenibacillus alvei TaxID=44250 RepID=UPI0023AF23E5|nr:IS5 family transposase [Paenibacillus alvei]